MSRIDDVQAHVRQARFSQVFKSSFGDVSFAECGRLEGGTPVLWFLPSSNTRLLACVFDWVAERQGLRIIFMERPGSGRTAACEPKERVVRSTALQVELMHHLGVKKANLISHSAGVIYLVHFMQQHPDLLFDTPHVAFISPWSPSDKFHALDLLPTSLISVEHHVMPVFMPVAASVDQLLTSCGSYFSKWGERMGMSTLSKPPLYRHIADGCFDKNAMRHAVFSLLMKEPCQGLTQDHLLSLNRGPFKGAPGAGRPWFVSTLGSLKWSGASKPRVKVVWAKSDGLIPEVARKWFNDLLVSSDKFESVDIRELKEQGHDDVLFLEEGLGWALEGMAVE